MDPNRDMDDILKSLEDGSSEGYKLTSNMFDFLGCVSTGELPIIKARNCILKIPYLDQKQQEHFWSSFLDVFWFLENELQQKSDEKSSESLVLLRKFLLDTRNNGLLPLEEVLTRLDPATLKETGIIVDDISFRKREVQLKSKIYFKQKKFNLFREESEGYAKLINFIREGSHDSRSRYYSQLTTIIGSFNLDPNRVLDMLLEQLEQNLQNDFLYEIIVDERLFRKSSIANLIGFRFQRYGLSVAEESEKKKVKFLDKRAAPRSFYALVCHLMAKGVFRLEDIWGHLQLKQEELDMMFSDYLEKKNKSTASLGVMNLLSSGKDNSKEQAVSEAFARLYSSGLNQKLVLLSVSLAELDNNATISKKIIAQLSKYDVANAAEVRNGIAKAIDAATIPIYRKIFPEYDGTNEELLTEALQVFKDIIPYLKGISYHMSQKPLTLGRVCRIMRYLNENGKGCELVADMMVYAILPSLSLTKDNPALSYEIWDVMKHFEYAQRYRMYGDWRELSVKVPAMAQAKKKTEIEIKKVLRRLTKESVKQYGRVIAKFTHSNPQETFNTFLPQIEVYGNIIMPVIDSLRYVTSLSWDVLVDSLIVRMSKGRDRIKDDGISVEDYLQHLSMFTGQLCRKYPLKNGTGVDHDLELESLLFYVVSQLANLNAIDSILLVELISKMSGIENVEEETMSNHLLYCRAGDNTLRYLSFLPAISRIATSATGKGASQSVAPSSSSAAQNGSVNVVPPSLTSFRRSSARLQDSLLSDGVVFLLMVLTALNKSTLCYSTSPQFYSNHLKHIGHFLDVYTTLIFMLREFLLQNVSLDRYASLLPDMEMLTEDLKLDIPTAFFFCRPVIHLLERKNSLRYEIFEALNTGKGEVAGGNKESAGDSGDSDGKGSWVVSLPLPPNTWDTLHPSLYETFWSLSLYDILVPTSQYELEIQRLKTAAQALEQGGDAQQPKTKRQRDKLMNQAHKLSMELSKQKANHAIVKRKMLERCGQWFKKADGTPNEEAVTKFIELCIFTRRTFSSEDALYSAVFVRLLNEMATEYFSTLRYCDTVLKDLSVHICTATQNEAIMLGHWLLYTVDLLILWHDDPTVYEAECAKKPGFARSFRDTKKGSTTHEDFCKVLRMWMDYLMTSFTDCLKSPEFVSSRNALIILTKISGCFPHTLKAGRKIESLINVIASDDEEEYKKRPDLQTIARMYLALLRKRLEVLAKLPVVSSSSGGRSSTSAASNSANTGASSSSSKRRAMRLRERELELEREREKERERSSGETSTKEAEATPRGRRERARTREREKEAEKAASSAAEAENEAPISPSSKSRSSSKERGRKRTRSGTSPRDSARELDVERKGQPSSHSKSRNSSPRRMRSDNASSSAAQQAKDEAKDPPQADSQSQKRRRVINRKMVK